MRTRYPRFSAERHGSGVPWEIQHGSHCVEIRAVAHICGKLLIIQGSQGLLVATPTPLLHIMFEQTAQRVVEVIANTQKIEKNKVTLDSTFEELQIDSLDGLNIVFALENEFDIDIPDDQAKELSTVRQAAERIHALLESRAQGANPSAEASA